jgi:hypothetical protein
LNPFLGTLTIIFLGTGIFTGLVTVAIRYGWRRRKRLEDI